MTTSKSIDKDEISKFSAMADQWWDKEGKFKPLHKFNPTRIQYIKDKINALFNKDTQKDSDIPLKNLELLDIGCGGGLLAEPLARMGANVTAIDASEKNIKIASIHAKKTNTKINYQCTSAEELASSGKKFDIITNMEVIEHVADVESFMNASCELLKKDGIMFIATMNRTIKSMLLAKIGAEYILRWLPIGTHDWNKFLKPSEINSHLVKNHLKIKEIEGVSYNMLKDEWKLSSDTDVNYIITAQKYTQN